MRPLITMRQALEDPHIFGTILPGPTWAAWRILLIAIMGEELTDEERVIFEQLTGRPARAAAALRRILFRHRAARRENPSRRCPRSIHQLLLRF